LTDQHQFLDGVAQHQIDLVDQLLQGYTGLQQVTVFFDLYLGILPDRFLLLEYAGCQQVN